MQKLIINIDCKIRDGKLKYDINNITNDIHDITAILTTLQALLSVKIDKFESYRLINITF